MNAAPSTTAPGTATNGTLLPPPLFGQTYTRLHAVGVGGMGLGPLAIYLQERGFQLTGEDAALSAPMAAALARAGVAITTTDTLPAATELVVYSSAIPLTHPTLLAAQTLGLRLVRRGELLAESTRDRRLVAVCGSHGKTTTTAMLVTVLRAAGWNFGYILGGLFNHPDWPPATAATLDTTAPLSDWVVAEVDESDGTIAAFAPAVTVAVNLDWDHPDHYRQHADLLQVFAELFARTRQAVLVHAAWAASMSSTSAIHQTNTLTPAAHATFGPEGDFTATLLPVTDAAPAEPRQHLALGGRFPSLNATVQASGDFNATNATAALAAAQLLGVTALTGHELAAYPGVRRRQTVLLATPTLTVLEDYAHHPAEISALLPSLRARADRWTGGSLRPGSSGRGTLRVVFQPHRFSRTAQFRTAFAQALSLADSVFLIEVYGAGESPLPGGTVADLQATLALTHPHLAVEVLTPAQANGLAALDASLRPGDLVAWIGAGDIETTARTWLATRDPAQTARWNDAAQQLRAAVSAATPLRREEPLARKTTLGAGGAARLYAEPADIDDLRALLSLCHEHAWPYLLLGRGSNLLVPDTGVDALVLSLRQPHWEAFTPQPDGRLWVGAGLRLKNLCGLAAKGGWGGFEFLEGIPGNVGGALRMNAGAMGGWIFDVVDAIQVLTAEGEVHTLPKAALHVGYRHCTELENAIALGAWLRPTGSLPSGDVARQIEAYREKRQQSQPREPSAGCVFKNPPGHAAGRLIDLAGLKGERQGDAEVSTVHANFIINRGEATASDVITLVRRVRARVLAVHGIELEPEVLLYGHRWEEIL